jgi:hypothetical protein
MTGKPVKPLRRVQLVESDLFDVDGMKLSELNDWASAENVDPSEVELQSVARYEGCEAEFYLQYAVPAETEEEFQERVRVYEQSLPRWEKENREWKIKRLKEEIAMLEAQNG